MDRLCISREEHRDALPRCQYPSVVSRHKAADFSFIKNHRIYIT